MNFRSVACVFLVLLAVLGLVACADTSTPTPAPNIASTPPPTTLAALGQAVPNSNQNSLMPTPTPNAAYTAIAVQKDKFATQSASHITMGATSYMATMTAAPAPPTSAIPPFVAININGNRYQDIIGSYAARSGYTFYVIDLSVTNTSTKVVDLRQGYFRVFAGQTTSYTFSDKSYGLAKELKNTILGPGEVARGELGFEVPKDQTITSVEYKDASHRVAVIIK